MNPADQFPPPIHNALPLRFRTWLDCYDSIPEGQRHAPLFHFYQAVTKKQFVRLYGYPQPQNMIGRVEYLVEREWLLARIGEQLLPARWTVSEWLEIGRALRSGRPFPLSEELGLENWVLSRLRYTLIRDVEFIPKPRS